MRRIKYLTFFIIGFYSTGISQLYVGKSYGFNVGFVSAFGTHVQRFGFVVQTYCIYEFAQFNASIRVYDNFKNLGPKGEYTEFSSSLGVCFGYGEKTNHENLFVSSIGNQTGYKNSVAYSYNFYSNKIKTSQVTGIIAFQFNHLSIIAENDILAKPMLDRFRTGAFLIQYQHHDFQYSLNCTMWTGQMGEAVRNDSLYPTKGYVNMNGGKYSNLSHGLLSTQIKFANEYGQYLQANAGIDAEQVRHAVQNKIIHDMPCVPKKWNNNLHIPMIDSNGNQYLYRKEQKIKTAKLFLNGYSSPNVFY